MLVICTPIKLKKAEMEFCSFTTALITNRCEIAERCFCWKQFSRLCDLFLLCFFFLFFFSFFFYEMSCEWMSVKREQTRRQYAYQLCVDWLYALCWPVMLHVILYVLTSNVVFWRIMQYVLTSHKYVLTSYPVCSDQSNSMFWPVISLFWPDI